MVMVQVQAVVEVQDIMAAAVVVPHGAAAAAVLLLPILHMRYQAVLHIPRVIMPPVEAWCSLTRYAARQELLQALLQFVWGQQLRSLTLLRAPGTALILLLLLLALLQA